MCEESTVDSFLIVMCEEMRTMKLCMLCWQTCYSGGKNIYRSDGGYADSVTG